MGRQRQFRQCWRASVSGLAHEVTFLRHGDDENHENDRITTSKIRLLASTAVIAGTVALSLAWLEAQGAGRGVAIDPDDIGGVVTSAKGPEAGVWVVAETTDLPTKFAKIVVTDDQGRYVLPDLPRATYQAFVRGYGLVDSPRVKAKPGQRSTSRPWSRPMPRAPRRSIQPGLVGPAGAAERQGNRVRQARCAVASPAISSATGHQ